LGANFQEFIGVVNYQPCPKLNINTRAVYYYKGSDTLGANFGGNIFKPYNSRNGDDGYTLANGNKATCLNLAMNISYEIKQHLFVDLGITNRKLSLQKENTTQSSTLYNVAMRLNIGKREYDY
jgi:hypothetical protein